MHSVVVQCVVKWRALHDGSYRAAVPYSVIMSEVASVHQLYRYKAKEGWGSVLLMKAALGIGWLCASVKERGVSCGLGQCVVIVKWRARHEGRAVRY